MARVIAMLIFGSLGVMLVYVGAGQFIQQRRLLEGARVVEARITRSEVCMSKSNDTDQRLLRDNSTTSYTPQVKFMYQLDGKTHESGLLYPTEIVESYASRAAAEEELRPFPVNATVRAHVNPRLPDKAFLIPRGSAAPVVFILVGLVLPIATWFVSRWF
ncbi:MAG TPA: DUF3592 domain-containing protein [Phycisphaerales bacterium]|nr:DUF3592 domain-containing protein [Phycisphaerales bacterium]